MHECMIIPTSSNDKITNLEFEPIGNIIVSISLSSQEFATLMGCRGVNRYFATEKNKWTLKIDNIDVKTHDEAQKLMIKITNSLFFQIDLLTGHSITLVTEQVDPSIRNLISSNKTIAIDKTKLTAPITKDKTKLTAPKREYDNEAMAFYWYAKSANSMPLFQFLAYYQVIEFYFPVYSEIKAKQQLRNLIIDPNFNPDRDIDIAKLLKVIKDSGCGKSSGTEVELLENTLESCMRGEELKEFITSNEVRKDFYLEKKNVKLSKIKLSLNSEKSDILITEVAKRIYDIRCQIVHSKSDNEKLLNPYSEEIKYIECDLKLIEFIAKRVLITSSKPLNLVEL
jgi:hypothetical protein